jgi:hypothetical protein
MLRFRRMHSLRLNPRLISQSLQFTKVTINSQYLQAQPRRCSYRVALSYRLIKCTLFRLLMLEPICLTAPRRQKVEEKERAILAATRAVFREKGPESKGISPQMTDPATWNIGRPSMMESSVPYPIIMLVETVCTTRMRCVCCASFGTPVAPPASHPAGPAAPPWKAVAVDHHHIDIFRALCDAFG